MFDCDIYITKTYSGEIPKRTEPEKMSKWISITKEKYEQLAKTKTMTSTHVREYNQIIKRIQTNGTWNTWEDDPEPMEFFFNIIIISYLYLMESHNVLLIELFYHYPIKNSDTEKILK